MDQEQLEKKLDWFEKERRADKQTIAALQKRLEELEGQIDKTNHYAQSLESEITKIGVKLTRINAFEEGLSKHRDDIKKDFEAQEKRIKGRERYAKDKHNKEISELNEKLILLKEELKVIPGMREAIETNRKEDLRQDKFFDALEKGIKENKDAHFDLVQKVRIIQDDHAPYRQRFADLQGEIAALRKRIDEQRGQYEMVTETYKKIDARVNELISTEEERREYQRNFIEEISRNQLDVEKSFKEWTKRFDSIEERAETLTTALQTYTEVERSLRSAQDEFSEITEQISRRIHEITEMQRLGEERFRLEWTTFKSDDQKRWVNYMLTQEEQLKESGRRFDRLNERTTTLEELLQDLTDTVQQSNEQIQSLVNGLLSIFRDWVATNERYNDAL